MSQYEHVEHTNADGVQQLMENQSQMELDRGRLGEKEDKM